MLQREAAVLQREAAVLKRETAVLQQEAAVLQREAAVLQREAAVLKREAAVLQREAAVLQRLAVRCVAGLLVYKSRTPAQHRQKESQYQLAQATHMNLLYDFPSNLIPDGQAREEQLRCFLAQREAKKAEEKQRRNLQEMHEQESYRRELMDRRQGESTEQQMQRQVHATTLLFEYQERVEERRRLRDRQEVLDHQKKEEVVQGQIARRQKQLLQIEKHHQERKHQFEQRCRALQDARDRHVAERLAQQEHELLHRRWVLEQQQHEEWLRQFGC